MLAEWHHGEWAYLRPGDTVESRVLRLRAACGRREPPATFVALADGQMLGSAMLLVHDMDTRPDLSPWLAGVFTAPGYRGRGIATQLSRHVIRHAAELGFGRLYLYTPTAENFYARLGWNVVERARYRDTAVTVMSYDATARQPVE